MARSKKEEREVRKLTKVGKKTIAVTIPIEIIRELGWREKQRVKIKCIRGGFVVRDYRSK
jgi:bifunctional DNA-binding transcriptional regulator/antitoxin component of YhaV-PrlF toxin-antitoxin module